MTPTNYLAIDIGGGSGIKLAVFDSDLQIVGEEKRTHISKVPHEFARFMGLLEQKVIEATAEHPVQAIGISSTGIFTPNGRCLKASSLPFLEGKRIATGIQEKLRVPTRLDNDANLGGIAIWQREKRELLYWTFGGGWGGSWVSNEGEILYFNGNHRGIHPTNEPGYMVSFNRESLKTLFEEHDFDYEFFEDDLVDHYDYDTIFISAEQIRAGRVISGKGIERMYNSTKTDCLKGSDIFALAEEGNEEALRAYSLFGKLLARAGREVTASTRRNDLPIYLGGQPSMALKYFERDLLEGLRTAEITSTVQRCPYNGNGQNANLYGAAMLAMRVDKGRK